jgi:RND family efflux transporter MFP subunit
MKHAYWSLPLISLYFLVIGMASNGVCEETTPEPLPVPIAGFTEARHDVMIGLAESGRIACIEVKEGDLVKSGAVLLFLNKSIQNLEIERIKLQLFSKAKLNYAKRRVEILNQQYESAQRLANNGSAISREELEAKELEYAAAQSELKQLITKEELENVELSLAREKLSRRILYAPVSGFIAGIMKSKGESVQAHEPVLRLVDSRKGRFLGNAEETIGHQLKVGQKVCLRLSTPEGPVLRPAEVTFLSTTVDTASGLMEVKAEFENMDEKVRLGGPAQLIVSNPKFSE